MSTQRWIDASVGHIQPGAAGSVELKGTVQLSRSSEGTLQLTHGGSIVGDVSAEECSAVLSFLGDEVIWPHTATIRSIRRDTGSREITEVKVSKYTFVHL
jgi:hypothetical protein